MNHTLSSEVRSKVGTNANHRIRERGHIPGVIYGSNMNSLPLEINSNELENFIRNNNNNGLVGLEVEGVNYTVFIKEIQKDPLTNKIIHVDFQQVSQNQKINVSVPIVLKGKSLVEKGGLIVQQQLRDVDIECLAQSIPQNLELDISNFKPGDSIRIGDMEFGEEISITQDPESIIASVAFAKQNVQDENSDEDIVVEEEK